MNESVFIKERKKERKSRICLNFYLTNTNDDQVLLNRIETLRHRDHWSITRFLKEASLEYVNRHLPGNPSLPLEHWTKDTPLSPSAKDRLELPTLKTPIPDYQGMSNETLEDLLAHPWKTRFGDRQIIAGILKKRKAEATL